MGLDQYAYAVEHHPNNTDFFFEQINDDGDEAYSQIAQWRKHPNLQGWMEYVFNRKADAQVFEGKTELFTDISITATDVSQDGLPQEIKDAAVEMAEMLSKIKEAVQETEAAHLLSNRVFNCQPIRLNTADLDQLEMHIKNKTLPKTQGFFFGDDSDEHYQEQDMKFIELARKAIRSGYDVYYDSWW